MGFEVEGGRTTVEVGGVKQDVNLNSVEAAPLRSMLEVGCICNNATLTFGAVDEGEGADSGAALDAPPDAAAAVNIDASPRPATAVVNGQATEAALLVAAAKCGVADLRQRAARLHEVAFSSERKRMEVRCRLDASVRRVATANIARNTMTGSDSSEAYPNIHVHPTNHPYPSAAWWVPVS